MSQAVPIAHAVLLVVYAGATFVYLRYFSRRTRELRLLCRLALLTTLAAHLGYLALVGLTQGAWPLVDGGQATSAMVMSMSAIYLGLEMRSGLRSTGVFVLGLGFVFELVAVFLGSDRDAVPPDLRSGRVLAHAGPALLGYAAMGLAAVHAALLLALRRHIKARRLGALYRNLPSLRALDALTVRANAAGFALVTIGLLTGGLWAAREWGSFFPSDLRLYSMVGVWALYGLLVASPAIPRASRRLRAAVTVASFVVLTFAFVVLGLVVESRHTF